MTFPISFLLLQFGHLFWGPPQSVAGHIALALAFHHFVYHSFGKEGSRKGLMYALTSLRSHFCKSERNATNYSLLNVLPVITEVEYRLISDLVISWRVTIVNGNFIN